MIVYNLVIIPDIKDNVRTRSRRHVLLLCLLLQGYIGCSQEIVGPSEGHQNILSVPSYSIHGPVHRHLVLPERMAELYQLL